MKDIIKILITIIVTSLIWLVALQDAKYNYLRKNEKEIWLPTLAIINDLRSASKEGKHEKLDQKLELFEKRWKSYIDGDDNPSEFYKEIIAIDSQLERKTP